MFLESLKEGRVCVLWFVFHIYILKLDRIAGLVVALAAIVCSLCKPSENIVSH